MDRKLLDILVCLFHKETRLELIEFYDISNNRSEFELSLKTLKKNNLNNENNEVNNSYIIDEGLKNRQNKNSEVKEGLLICKECTRFYPIVDEIPIILPDDLRDKKKDLIFLSKWESLIPNEILVNLKPWTVKHN